MASPELATVVEHMQRISELSLSSGPHTMQKRALLDMYFAAAPEILTVTARMLPVLVGELACEWLIPDECDLSRRVLYLHGGSWMAGSSSSHRPLIARLAVATGCPVLAVNYRLAPEFPFPAGLEDAIHAFQWLAGHSPEGEQPADKLFIMGDSAGGNLTLASMLALKQGGKRLPDAAVVFSPAANLEYERAEAQELDPRDPILNAKLLPFIVANYVQEQANLKDPLVSPLYGDLAGLPPTLLQVGDAEILYDDGCSFAEAANAQGSQVQLSVWPDMPHVFQGFAPLLPEAVQAIDELANFIRGF
ncbi:alpha/beta hydrolase [Halioxenophilus sp. WMMB6]|uniref:alpha/beta hydrolase n=1 Tax=Halioxenophilus sp. WMMB6 TaxID=3073815 RepID=UPI00295F51B5|nr:alpha/beta hydrolase [Halioxenophilus sp. WMMB6]